MMLTGMVALRHVSAKRSALNKLISRTVKLPFGYPFKTTLIKTIRYHQRDSDMYESFGP